MDLIRWLKEAINKEPLSKLGSFVFTYNPATHQYMSIHDEMKAAREVLNRMPELYSSLFYLSMLVVGKGLKFDSSNKKAVEYLEKWCALRKHLTEELRYLVLTTIAYGNGYLEKVYVRKGSKLILDNIKCVKDPSRMYVNLFARNDSEYWLYEVPMNVTMFDGRKVEMYRIGYFKGAKMLAQRQIRAIALHKNEVVQFKFGLGLDDYYGRGFVLHTLTYAETMKEIMENNRLIAKFKAIGRKFLVLGDKDNPATPEDVEEFNRLLQQYAKEENIVINKPIQIVPLSYQGDFTTMDSTMDYIRRAVMSFGVPVFMTPWSESSNRANARETRAVFSHLIAILQEKFAAELTPIFREVLRDAGIVCDDLEVKFEPVDLSPPEDRIRLGLDLLRSGVITEDEFREQWLGLPKRKEGEERELHEFFRKEQQGAGREIEGETITRGWRIIIKRRDDGKFAVWNGPKLKAVFDELEDAKAFWEEEVREAKKLLNIFPPVPPDLVELEEDVVDELQDLYDELEDEIGRILDKLKKKAEKLTLNLKVFDAIDKAFDKHNKKWINLLQRANKKSVRLSVGTGALDREDEERLIRASSLTQLLPAKADKLKVKIAQAIARGDGITKIKQAVRDELKKMRDYEINTVVRTQVHGTARYAKLLSWKEQGFTKVQWVATIDEKTCDICRSRHRKIYNITDLLSREDGVIPHPNCRCTVELWE